jgi:hypothetical protein
VEFALERDGNAIKRALFDAVPDYCPQLDRRGSNTKEDGVILIDEVKKMRLAN